MKVQCQGCRIAFNIPEEKIPDGRSIRIPCPKCKSPIEIDCRQSVQELPEKSQPAAAWTPDNDPIADYASAVDVVEEGVKTALLCVSNTRLADKIALALQELDFYVVHSSRSGFALGKLHHNTYDLIMLEESFDSAGAAENLVLHHVQLLPMHLRRQFFLCLISDSLPTLDAMLAFRMGVNLILNLQDLEKAKIILARSLKEYKTFYGFFNTELNKKQA